LAVAARREAPLFLALALVGTTLVGLLVGFEPVGGDPDRLYRPLKAELAGALAEGRIPFWSSRFGLGIPLVAESHVAAFYPPNLVLYRTLDVSTAYRISMWLHYVALVATTYAYARCIGLAAWGSALAGVSFTLCGFQTIHSSHEPFYSLMPYLPMALCLTERYMASGRVVWLAILAACLSFQWSLGHFQIQTWTNGLVILTGLWRGVLSGRPWRRALGAIVGAVWGTAMAAVQLGLSWQFAKLVGQTRRAASELIYYSFPPLHWFELALPRLIRELRLGPEDPYWFGQETWGYEAALYVGTIPLVFAFVGAVGRGVSRSTVFWKIMVPVSFGLATMPRWWPQAYLRLLELPGIGYFRVPARYTLLTSFGLAILAGEGFDAAITKTRFRIGVCVALVFGICAAAAAYLWTRRADVYLVSFLDGANGGLAWAGATWLVALSAVLAWRSQRLPAWGPLALAGIDLGILFYMGTTKWGWAISLPSQSPVLTELARRSPIGSVGGEVENLPVRANLTTGFPYIGFSLPKPNLILNYTQERLTRTDPHALYEGLQAVALKRWFQRFRLEYLVTSTQSVEAIGTALGRWRDPALDQIAKHGPTDSAQRVWSVVQLDEPLPEARVATRARIVAKPDELIDRLFRSDERDTALFLSEEGVLPRADGSRAQLISWNGEVATVEHEGPCDLVIARTFDPGWHARIGDGPSQSVVVVDGGFQAVRLEGSGTHRITLRYQAPGFIWYTAISLVAWGMAAGVIMAAVVPWTRSGARGRAPPRDVTD
jgi:hypothetical protein